MGKKMKPRGSRGFGAGKLKHDRMIKITALVLTFGGSILACLAFNEKILLPASKEIIIVLLAGILFLLLLFQNAKLNALEQILGWDEKAEEGKMNLLARWIDKAIKPLTR